MARVAAVGAAAADAEASTDAAADLSHWSLAALSHPMSVNELPICNAVQASLAAQDAARKKETDDLKVGCR